MKEPGIPANILGVELQSVTPEIAAQLLKVIARIVPEQFKDILERGKAQEKANSVSGVSQEIDIDIDIDANNNVESSKKEKDQEEGVDLETRSPLGKKKKQYRRGPSSSSPSIVEKATTSLVALKEGMGRACASTSAKAIALSSEIDLVASAIRDERAKQAREGKRTSSEVHLRENKRKYERLDNNETGHDAIEEQRSSKSNSKGMGVSGAGGGGGTVGLGVGLACKTYLSSGPVAVGDDDDVDDDDDVRPHENKKHDDDHDPRHPMLDFNPLAMMESKGGKDWETSMLRQAITKDLKNFQEVSERVLQLTRDTQAFSEQLTRLHEAAMNKYDTVRHKLKDSVESFYSNYIEMQTVTSKFIAMQDRIAEEFKNMK